MVNLSNLKQDRGLEVSGKWIKFHDGRVLLARFPNSKSRHLVRKLIEEYGVSNLSDDLDGEASAKFAELYARFAILDWEGFVDENGNEIPYTWEIGRQVLMDEEQEEFRLFVVSQSARRENYRAKQVSKAVGESQGS